MFRLTSRQLAIFVLGITVLPAIGQNASPANQAPKAIQAYTVEFKIVNVQTLANGTTITRETTEKNARDSQGRTLTVTTQPQFSNGRISDRVENTQIMWSSVNKKASVIHLPTEDQRHGCWSTDSHRFSINYPQADAPIRSGPVVAGTAGSIAGVELNASPKSERTREDLGTTNIQGLEAKGERWTTVIPAGRVGNDSPITTTQETWRAPGFPFPLRSISDDPRTGQRTRETTSLTIGEPDPNLFQPPEGYEVVNEDMHEVACQQQ
jgi:hypothetical protein